MPRLTPPLRAAIFSLVMILCASASNALMDTLALSRYHSSVFSTMPESWQQWFNPAVSFRNKWKSGDPAQGEAFPLSSTALVAVTDAWHFCKFLTIGCLYLALIAPFTLLFRLKWYGWLLVLVAVDLLRGGVFELLFQFVLPK